MSSETTSTPASLTAAVGSAPASAASTRRPTSSTSAARWRRSSSSSALNAVAVSWLAAYQAFSAAAPASICSRAAPTSASSSSRASWAVKIAASLSLLRRATSSRSCSIAVLALARADSSRRRSISGPREETLAGALSSSPKCRTGPSAIPADAGIPAITVPGSGSSGISSDGSATAGPAAPRAASAAPRAVSAAPLAATPATRVAPAATPSPNPPSASSRSAASASSAWGPDAVAISSSPRRATSVIKPVRLRALTGPAPPALASRRSASKRPASSTTSAAGRAWRPISLSTGMRASAPGGPPGTGSRRRGSLLGAELLLLHRDRAPGLDPHLLQRGAASRRRGGGDRALDERCLAQLHAAIAVEQLHRHLRAHQGAAEIHQHEHAVVAHGPLDRGAHALHVGADRAVLEAAGSLEPKLLAAHLPGQLDDAIGQRGAVRDNDDANHWPRARRPDAGARLDVRTGAAWRARSASGRFRCRTRPAWPLRPRPGRTGRRRRPSRSGTSRA